MIVMNKLINQFKMNSHDSGSLEMIKLIRMVCIIFFFDVSVGIVHRVQLSLDGTLSVPARVTVTLTMVTTTHVILLIKLSSNKSNEKNANA